MDADGEHKSKRDGQLYSTNAESFELSYMHFDESKYEVFLQNKVKTFLQSLISYHMKNLELLSSSSRTELENICRQDDVVQGTDGTEVANFGICTLLRSPTRHCRQRVRFALRPSLSAANESIKSPFEYVMWEGGGPNVSVKVRIFTALN